MVGFNQFQGAGRPIPGQTPPFRPVGVGLPQQNQFGQANTSIPGGFDFSGGARPSAEQLRQMAIANGAVRPDGQGLDLRLTAPQKPVAGMNTPGINPNSPQTGGHIIRPEAGNNPGFTPAPGGGIPRGTNIQQQNPNQPQQFAQQPQQQFGLGGAEQAIQAGAFGGANAIQTGQQNALGTLLAGFGAGQQGINRGVNILQGGGGFGGGGGGFGGGGGATAQQAAAASLDQSTGQNQFQQGVQGIQQFQDAGLQGQQRQLALSGALGQEAFDQARINDPAQAFLREQGEQSIINQNAATGGLGGGAIGRELARFGQGLASQNLQQERAAAGQLAGQGLQAAGQAGQLLGQAGSLEGQLAGQQAGLTQQANLQNAQLGTQASIANANNANQAGIAAGRNQTALRQSAAGLLGQGAGFSTQLAGQGAGIQNQAGTNVANLLSGAGNQIGGLRFNAGQNIANTIGNTTGGLSNLQQQQGSGFSDIIGSGGANQAQIFQNAGNAAGSNQAQLGGLLSNIATGQGTQAGNIAQQGGFTQAQLAQQQGQNQQQLIGNLLNSAAFGGAFGPATPQQRLDARTQDNTSGLAALMNLQP
jgi:hypothetical protein